jgi:hypothetical protein
MMKVMMQMTRSLLVFFAFTLGVFAVPALKRWQSFQLSDGVIFEARLRGDEWFSWLETKTGEVALLNKETRFYEYAKVVELNGHLELLTTGVSVGHLEKSITPLVPITPEQLAQIWKNHRINRSH